MKKLIFLFLSLFLFAGNYAINVPSDIKQITIYRQGAKITHSTEANLVVGNNEVVLQNLTSTIDANSIQVSLKGQAILLSASSRINYMSPPKSSKRIKELEDSLTILLNKLDWIMHEQEIYRGEEKLVTDNQKLVNEKEKVTAAEIAQLADFYRNRITEIRKKVYNNEIDFKKIGEKKMQIEQQLSELKSNKNEPTGEIVLNINADQASRISITFSYLTNNAGWNPLYDIRCESTSQPVDLVYKANIYQQTGFDWNHADLIVSTGNPTLSNERPVLNPWYIDFYQPNDYSSGMQYKSARSLAPSSAMNMMSVSDKSEELQQESVPVPYEVVETTNQMATEYEIKIKQDIPSDGKEHIVPISNFKVPATYVYHSVPKLDQHVFLLAKVNDYSQYNLLSGSTNLFFESTFVGQSTLNPEITSDSLLLSLGRDDRVKIERNILKDLTSKQLIGLNKKELKGYEIIIRNNKKLPVTIEILDQLPISSNNDIVVTPEDLGGANYNADYGRLFWKIDLASGETKKLRFVYSVKYPKDKQVTGL
jgi:uncharacterized protein (TIGR02231 family)